MANPLVFFPQLMAALFTPDINSIPPDMKRLVVPGSREQLDLDGSRRQHQGADDDQRHVVRPVHQRCRMFNKIPLPMGKEAADHGRGYHITPGRPRPPRLLPADQRVLQRAWFDKWLKGIDNRIDSKFLARDALPDGQQMDHRAELPSAGR